MIKMVKAKDLKHGMIISTDGLIVRMIDENQIINRIDIGGVCHGFWKTASFRPDDELPIYYDDTNGGED